MNDQDRSTTSLFDKIERTEVRPKRHSEPIFANLNTSARAPYEIMRTMLDGWFSRFPDLAKAELRARFRSTTDSQHRSAFFELYLHELLSCIGYGLEAHPELSGTPKRPDYVAVGQQGRLFYVEATASFPSRREQAEGDRAAQVYDSINDMESPNFFVAMRIRGAPITPPPGRKLADALSRWLRDLDPDALGEALSVGGFDALPSFEWSHDGWDLSFLPVAKSSALRGTPGVRPIGITMPEVKILETHKGIRAAVCNKATRYGELDLPYLVAVNVVDEHVDTIDIMNALFGEEFVAIRRMPDGSIDQTPGRKRDGVWFGPVGPCNTRVSGVLIATDLTEWTVHHGPILMHNPYASRPFPVEAWPLPQRVPDERKEQIVDRPGTDIIGLLKLPQPWPPADNTLGARLPGAEATE